MSKYDEDLKKACEILDNTELDELLKVAVEAMDDAAVDIGMEANQEWHAKITLESALIHIAEKVVNQPQLTIPKSIADLADKEFKWLKDDVLGFGYSFIEYGCESPELRLWVTNGDCWDIEAGKRANILSAYLAGKALGVDLVKVVEG